MNETIFTNARIVLENEVVDGSLAIRDGLIADLSDGPAAGAIDLGGDYLLPGLIELHTDHLEGHYTPRPGVRWNPVAAVQAHDAQIAASGITTVFDALRIGMDEDTRMEIEHVGELADAIETAGAGGRLRADHLVHLRCEVSTATVLEEFELLRKRTPVRLVSLMDHAPGQRQFTSMEVYSRYYQGKLGMSDEAFAKMVFERTRRSALYSDKHRKALAGICRAEGIVVASHDDATAEHVAEAAEYDVRIAEFPTTLEAATASHASGMAVLMGAPNVVRGGSHSGNVAATALADAGVLDVLSSDYVPFSLMQAVFVLADRRGGDIDLPEAVRTVTATPARAVGLDDRGRIATGLRADLVRVSRRDEIPVVRSLWRQGERVM